MLKIISIVAVPERITEGLLGAYDIHIATDAGTVSFWAEARACQNSEAQIDWSDELGDLLSTHHASSEAYSQISLAVFQEFLGSPIELPIVLELTA